MFKDFHTFKLYTATLTATYTVLFLKRVVIFVLNCHSGSINVCWRQLSIKFRAGENLDILVRIVSVIETNDLLNKNQSIALVQKVSRPKSFSKLSFAVIMFSGRTSK